MIIDPGFVFRLVKAGWLNHMVTHAINTVRQWPDMVTRSPVLSAVRNAMIANLGVKNWTETRWHANHEEDASDVDFSTDGFTCRDLPDDNKADITILELAEGVNLPQGNDRGTLTEVIELVRQNPLLDCKLSEIQNLINHQGLAMTSYDENRDRECKTHWKNLASQVKSRFYDATNGKKFAKTGGSQIRKR
jgi:hypothetical protein